MAAHPFFITGLPRSRTAWMAVAATTAHSVCFHEPSAGEYAPAAAVWEMPSLCPVGISDSGLGMHLQRILEEIGPKTLVIQRDPEEVIASYARYADVDAEDVRGAVAGKLSALLDALAVEHPLIRHVNFHELRNVAVVRDCLDWLGVKPLNLEQLMRMNVQSDLDFNLTRARALVAA